MEQTQLDLFLSTAVPAMEQPHIDQPHSAAGDTTPNMEQLPVSSPEPNVEQLGNNINVETRPCDLCASRSDWDFLRTFYARVETSDLRVQQAEGHANQLSHALHVLGQTNQKDRLLLNALQHRIRQQELTAQQYLCRIHALESNLQNAEIDNRAVRDELQHEKRQHEMSMATIMRLQNLVEQGEKVAQKLLIERDNGCTEYRSLYDLIQEAIKQQPERANGEPQPVLEVSQNLEKVWKEQMDVLEERSKALAERERFFEDKQQVVPPGAAVAPCDTLVSYKHQSTTRGRPRQRTSRKAKRGGT